MLWIFVSLTLLDIALRAFSTATWKGSVQKLINDSLDHFKSGYPAGNLLVVILVVGWVFLSLLLAPEFRYSIGFNIIGISLNTVVFTLPFYWLHNILFDKLDDAYLVNSRKAGNAAQSKTFLFWFSIVAIISNFSPLVILILALLTHLLLRAFLDATPPENLARLFILPIAIYYLLVAVRRGIEFKGMYRWSIEVVE